MFNLKKRKLFFSAILLSVSLLTACHSNLTGHEIVGVWEHAGSRIEFTEKGQFVKGEEKYSFSVNEQKITVDNNGEAMVMDYSINANGTLTLNGLVYYPITENNR